ncbi:MAG: hypothetical protein QOF42_3605 [Gammaproteobacteria bacterium]|jgi:hypothetical protein|nr:hypothetical protein [Gammaproteobacteria bacterium]
MLWPHSQCTGQRCNPHVEVMTHARLSVGTQAMTTVNRRPKAQQKAAPLSAVAKSKSSVPVEDITRSIVILRSQRIIFGREVAAIYGVTTGRLNEAVKRNAECFPVDFMFHLSITLGRYHMAISASSNCHAPSSVSSCRCSILSSPRPAAKGTAPCPSQNARRRSSRSATRS